CHVTILNTLDHLGKFDGKANKGYFFGYSINSKAFRVYNIRTRRVEEYLHIEFLENKPTVAGVGPEWLFDIDMLTKSVNYVPVIAGINSNDFVGTKDSIGAGQSSRRQDLLKTNVFMPLWKDGSPLFDSSPKISDDPKMPGLETIATYDDSKKEDEFTNLESSIYVSPTPTIRTHKNHPLKQEELLQFKLQKVWILVDLPKGRKAIGTKWVFKNKKDKRGIMIKNKA
nr:ribonuclease H-like domain-containing protein [Tanacetum cinerariifolium]